MSFKLKIKRPDKQEIDRLIEKGNEVTIKHQNYQMMLDEYAIVLQHYKLDR